MNAAEVFLLVGILAVYGLLCLLNWERSPSPALAFLMMVSTRLTCALWVAVHSWIGFGFPTSS